MMFRAAHSDDALAIARFKMDSWQTTYAGIVPADSLVNLSYEQQRRVWGHHISTLAEDLVGELPPEYIQLADFLGCGHALPRDNPPASCATIRDFPAREIG
jgi:hypothetical protein